MKKFTIPVVMGCALLALLSVAAIASAQGQTPRFEETLVVTATPRAGSSSEYFLTFSGPVSWRERAAGAPPAIRAWFLPDKSIGYEFIYPKG